jgi:predicted ATP-binding protein involved in virulence
MRVRHIAVHKLFGRFDHSIALNRDERVTIIHGPNGYGKTALLKLVYALFNHDQDVLCNTPFESLRVDLDGGLSIVLRRSSVQHPAGEGLARLLSEQGLSGRYLGLEYSVQEKGKELITYAATDTFYQNSNARPVVVDAMRQSINEVKEAARSAASPAKTKEDTENDWSDWCARTLAKLREGFEHPEGYFLYTFLSFISVHLVSIERLFVRRASDPKRQRAVDFLINTARDDEDGVTFKSAVAAYSNELRDLVQAAQSNYAEIAQKLDRTFPQRVMAAPQAGQRSDDELKRELVAIEERRSHLMTLGLLPGDDTALQPPAETFEDSTRKVLWIYVQDNKEKLAVFDELAGKVDLLQGLINKRFQFKRLRIDVKRGFSFESGEGQELPPTALSSGEQHELIMVYECLFRLQRDSLLLIDEPELSLHVAWQVEFLRDLLRIIEISQIDVLIATHSPQIIHDRWDLTVELKSPQADQSAA